MFRQAGKDRLLATAAGVVFYGLLALFPAVTALVSSYGLFADPTTIGDNLRRLALMLPQGAFSIVENQIERVVANDGSALGFGFVAGLLIALWSANAGMKALLDALNVTYEVKETRSFFRFNAVSLGLTLAGLIGVLLMVCAVVVTPLAIHLLGLEGRISILLQFGRWPILALLIFSALVMLYRFGPCRQRSSLRLLAPGAAAAAIFWLIGSSLLSWYLSNVTNYDATYGSLGAAMGLMTWMWMSTIVVLFGAEINFEIEKATSPAQGGPAGAT